MTRRGFPRRSLRKYGVSNATFYKWRWKYGGRDVSEAKRLTSLEEERQTEAPVGRSHARRLDLERNARKYFRRRGRGGTP
ncbi:MAG: hypothetical protein E5Y82_33160 [Mesorhizobium sp.]|nr:MAG: hypothetical protein E5Y82_33160 [Mesorhizobium sp.]